MATRGTTTTTAAQFRMIAGRARPATDGNKNIAMGARRMSKQDQFRQVAPIIDKAITGPFLGRRTL